MRINLPLKLRTFDGNRIKKTEMYRHIYRHAAVSPLLGNLDILFGALEADSALWDQYPSGYNIVRSEMPTISRIAFKSKGCNIKFFRKLGNYISHFKFYPGDLFELTFNMNESRNILAPNSNTPDSD